MNDGDLIPMCATGAVHANATRTPTHPSVDMKWLTKDGTEVELPMKERGQRQSLTIRPGEALPCTIYRHGT